MAVAGSEITNAGRSGLSNGKWLIWGTITGPASYTSGGEVLTRAVCSSIWGVNDISGLACSPAGNTTHALGAVVNFERTGSSSTNVGEFHYYAAADAHTHDLKIIGGQAAAATDTLFVPAATDLLGKQEAGNADVLGADVLTKGGVMLSTADVPASEAAAATDFSTYTFFVWGIGG
jgi:hypothetical protein